MFLVIIINDNNSFSSAPDCRMRPYPQHRRDRRTDSKVTSGSEPKSKQVASNSQSNILMPIRPQQRCQYPMYDSKLGIPYITMYLHFRPLGKFFITLRRGDEGEALYYFIFYLSNKYLY